MLWILAQTPPMDADHAVGLLERLTRGGVPLICLAVALLAVIGLVLQYRANAALEQKYREDLENRAKESAKDAPTRLADAKQDAKDRAAEVDKLMRERMAAEKESDATLAQAVRVIEANTKMLERVEKNLG